MENVGFRVCQKSFGQDVAKVVTSVIVGGGGVVARKKVLESNLLGEMIRTVPPVYLFPTYQALPGSVQMLKNTKTAFTRSIIFSRPIQQLPLTAQRATNILHVVQPVSVASRKSYVHCPVCLLQGLHGFGLSDILGVLGRFEGGLEQATEVVSTCKLYHCDHVTLRSTPELSKQLFGHFFPFYPT